MPLSRRPRVPIGTNIVFEKSCSQVWYRRKNGRTNGQVETTTPTPANQSQTWWRREETAERMKSFYRAFNAVFGKVAGVASEEVTVELLKVKCLPVLLYGLEACPISNKQFNSLDFVLKGCFRKIFRTRSAEVVQNCMLIFNCMFMQECVAKRKCKFRANYVKSDNILCYMTVKTLRHMN